MRLQLAPSCHALVWICLSVAGITLACSDDPVDALGIAPSNSADNPSTSGPGTSEPGAGTDSSRSPPGNNALPTVVAPSSSSPASDPSSPSTGPASTGDAGDAGGATSSSGPTDGNVGTPGTVTASGPPGDQTGGAAPSNPSGGVSGAPPGGNVADGGSNGGDSNANGGSPVGPGDSAGGPNGGASAGPADPEGPEPYSHGQPPAAAVYFKKGINLGNRMEAPNEGDWGGSVLASDFPFIAARGFDHVRIPMRFSGHALGTAPYTIDASFFQRVDTVLDQATSAGLAAIIDLHAYDEMASAPSAERERFLGLWSQIAERYADRPETVAFELLNEPNTQLDTIWNDIAAAAIDTVRTTNPRRLLVVDTVFWADPSRLSMLTLPNDANLLVSIHLYEPKLFSFQGKSWMGEPYMTTGVVFPGPPQTPITPVQAALDQSWAAAWFEAYNTLPAASNPSGPATVDAQVAHITAYRAATGRTVYNGEWGPQDGADMTSRANLVRMVRERCEAEGIAWAIWEDPNNMKLFDSGAGTWVTPIIDALLP